MQRLQQDTKGQIIKCLPLRAMTFFFSDTGTHEGAWLKFLSGNSGYTVAYLFFFFIVTANLAKKVQTELPNGAIVRDCM